MAPPSTRKFIVILGSFFTVYQCFIVIWVCELYWYDNVIVCKLGRKHRSNPTYGQGEYSYTAWAARRREDRVRMLLETWRFASCQAAVPEERSPRNTHTHRDTRLATRYFSCGQFGKQTSKYVPVRPALRTQTCSISGQHPGRHMPTTDWHAFHLPCYII